VKTTSAPIDAYTSPKYKIVQRRGVEFHEMTDELDAKLNLTIPHELVVTIDLPLLTTTEDANLDVSSKRISLVSEKPAKYKMDIALPYEVNEENGNAKFDKSKRQLIITLPVVQKCLRMTDFHREDSGIESDQPRVAENSDETESPMDDNEDDYEEASEEKISIQQSEQVFMDTNIDYVLPNFTFNHIDDILAFTLHVKNVDPASIAIDRKDLLNLAYIKFTSIGSGFFPIHYSFCVKFPSQCTSIFRDITAEAWDNNVIFQFELNNYDFSSYEVGLNEMQMENYDIAERLIGRQAMTSQGKEIEDDSLSIEVRSDKETELVIEVTGEIFKN
jgi:dynein assembly factor 2